MTATMTLKGVWLRADPLLLASTSQTRRCLIEAAEIPVETIDPRVDERAIENERSLEPSALASRLATAKAQAVSTKYPDRVVVGADQVLAIDRVVLHKANDEEAAKTQLRQLQGQWHLLYSAVAVTCNGKTRVVVESASLKMRTLDTGAIDLYVHHMGKRVTMSVGGYQLEGLGIHLFEQIEGNYSTILGLPMLLLLTELRCLGVLAI